MGARYFPSRATAAAAAVVATPMSLSTVTTKSDAAMETALSNVAVTLKEVLAVELPVAPTSEDRVGAGGEYAMEKPLLTPAPCGGVMSPLPAGIHTDMVASMNPDATATSSTFCVAGQMSTPVPSPRMKGMIGLSATTG